MLLIIIKLKALDVNKLVDTVVGSVLDPAAKAKLIGKVQGVLSDKPAGSKKIDADDTPFEEV